MLLRSTPASSRCVAKQWRLFRHRNRRHSFAVRRLVLWHEQGLDIGQRMLALSTYLGHVKVSSTYWYLTGVPELMGLLGQRFERFANPWEDGDE